MVISATGGSVQVSAFSGGEWIDRMQLTRDIHIGR